MTAIVASQVPSWQEKLVEASSSVDACLHNQEKTSTNSGQEATTAHFELDKAVNERIALYLGPTWRLECDALVNPVDETFGEARIGSLANDIHTRGGSLMQREIDVTMAHLGSLRGKTGDTILTAGYDLPSRHVIHTISPRYSEKYRNAALNMLHTCYRACLIQCVQNNWRTVCIPPIHSERKGFATELGVHMVLRTVRRYMEKFVMNFDRIILCLLKKEDFELYSRVMPLYFPRSERELSVSRQQLPADVGGAMGEIVIEERGIRISAAPGGGMSASFAESSGPKVLDLTTHATNSTLGMRDSSLGTVEGVPGTPMMSWNDDFARLASESEHVDLFPYFRVLYRSGLDHAGRIILVALAPYLNDDVQWDHLQLYVVKLLRDMGEKREFIVVYVEAGAIYQPDFGWLRALYNVVPNTYKRNLRALYIVQPSWWHLAAVTFARPFVSSKIWQRMHTVDDVSQLSAFMPLSQLIIPDDVLRSPSI